jgi:elongation factor Tu
MSSVLDAVDAYIPVPPRGPGEPFLMPIESVLTISGRGTVVTGAVGRGALMLGESVDVVGLAPALTTVATGAGNVRKVAGAGGGG